jgi:hypothetical protein
MSAEEVLPCPFCGNEVKSQSFWYGCAPGNEPRGYYVFCLECSETDALDGPRRDTLEDAIAAWNRRTPPAMSADHIGDAQGWRDIATAPRDGDDLLVSDDETGARHVSYWTGECWSGPNGFKPTHWQPLPTAPSAHPAPIKPSVDTGELRERVLASIGSAWAHGTHGKPFDVKAETDAILDLIQTERAG